MRKFILAAALAAAPAIATAGGADGLWKTAVSDSGGYLLVTVADCASDAAKTCGTITKAFSKSGEDPGYAHLGKPIVWDMESDDGASFSGGNIWDPEKDKTYSSKMTLKGDVLDVKGCIAIICSGQSWTRSH